MDIHLSIDGSGGSQGNASFNSCHIIFTRTGTGWSMYTLDHSIGASPLQVVGQAGQVSMGACTLDGLGSSVTTQGSYATFTAKVMVDHTFWVNRWIYMLRNDGTVLDQYWMNF